MTHHGASIEAIAPRNQRGIVSAAYASELRPLVDRYQPACWITAHTHQAMTFCRASFVMTSNSRDYPGEATSFYPYLPIEVRDDRADRMSILHSNKSRSHPGG